MGFYDRMKEERRIRENAARGLAYKVLQADLVRDTDRERAAQISALVTSSQDGHILAGHEGFSYRDLDLRGRVGVVCYKGIEVMMLFKREIVEVTPAPGDPIPERPITEPKDAWIQVPLLRGKDEITAKGITSRLSSALQSVKNLEALWNSEKSKRQSVEEKLPELEKKIGELSQLSLKVTILEKTEQEQKQEIEKLNLQFSNEKRGRTEDKVKLVRELFPVFNTLWLAGEHRVGDYLYETIRKQLIEALEKVGAALVEPNVGDEFDPQQHHAIHSYPFPEGAKEIGMVVKVFRVGWRIVGGHLVEAADVAVGVEEEKKEETVETKESANNQ